MVGSVTAAATSSADTALITGGFTLGAGILGGVIALLLERGRRKTARQQWLLDRRHDNYAVFIDASYALAETYRTVRRSTGPRRMPLLHVGAVGSGRDILSDVQDAYTTVREHLTKLQMAHERVRLVAPTATGAAASDLQAAANSLVRRFGERDSDKVLEATTLYNANLDEFVRLAQTELRHG